MCRFNVQNYNLSNIFARALLVWTHHVTETETGEYPRIFPNFQNCASCEKDLKDTIDTIWGENMLEYLSLDIICSSKLIRSRKTVRFSEQITSADKYPSIFSPQMGAVVYLSRSAAKKMGIGKVAKLMW